jgi:hypothetical protein
MARTVLGTVVAPVPFEVRVFRLLALTLTLALSVGPSAGLICHLLCDDHAAPSTACHEHQFGTTAFRPAGGDCDTSVGVAQLPASGRVPVTAPVAAAATVPGSADPIGGPHGWAVPDDVGHRHVHHSTLTVLRI